MSSCNIIVGLCFNERYIRFSMSFGLGYFYRNHFPKFIHPLRCWSWCWVVFSFVHSFFRCRQRRWISSSLVCCFVCYDSMFMTLSFETHTHVRSSSVDANLSKMLLVNCVCATHKFRFNDKRIWYAVEIYDNTKRTKWCWKMGRERKLEFELRKTHRRKAKKKGKLYSRRKKVPMKKSIR